MPTLQTIETFIKAVEQEPHDKVIDRFYTDEASIQENQNEPRQGKANLIKHEQMMLSAASTVHSECIRPVLREGDNVMIRWKFRFEWKDRSFTEIEEIAYQLWEGEKIHREQFFYDPKQFVPRKK